VKLPVSKAAAQHLLDKLARYEQVSREQALTIFALPDGTLSADGANFAARSALAMLRGALEFYADPKL
jgi:hypothetical protein